MSIFGKLVATIPEKPILFVSYLGYEVRSESEGGVDGILKDEDSRHGK